jgi:hypothetical protein
MADDAADNEAPDATKPKGDEPEGRLLRVKRWHKESIGGVEDWRKKAETDYAFRAGHQWEEADRKKLEDEQRPVITFNRCGPIIDVTSGLEINAREEIALKPRERSDSAACEAGMALIEYVRDACDAEDEETDAFEDLLISGMGWTEAYVDPDSSDVKQRRVDPFEMIWPGKCKQKNLGDAKYLMRVREISRDEAEAMWPDASPGQLDARWAKTGVDTGEEGPAFSDPGYDQGSTLRSDSDTVTVVECQWRETVPRVRMRRIEPDPQTGQPRVVEKATLDVERAKAFAAQAAQADPPIQLEMNTVREVQTWQGFYGSVELSYEKLPVQGEGFTWKAMTGKWDREDECFYGLLRMAHDPQRYANKWLSQSLHILNTTAKNTVIYDPLAFADNRKFEEKWAQPGATIALAEGAVLGNSHQVIESQSFPTGFFQLMQFAIESIREVTGVNLELAGMQDNDQAGVLEYQRKQSAMTVLAPFFGALRRMRKGIGRVLLRLIIEYMDEEEMLRVVGDAADQEPQKYPSLQPGQEQGPAQPTPGQAAVAALKAAGFDKYDVVVDEAPSSPHAKERAWAAIQQMLPILQSFGSAVPPEVWVEIARYSPLPSAMSEKISQAITKQPTPEEQQKAQEKEQIIKQGAIAKVSRDEAAAEKDRAIAEQTRSEIGQPPPQPDDGHRHPSGPAGMARDLATAEKERALAEKARMETSLAPYKAAGELLRHKPDPFVPPPPVRRQ